MDENVQMLGCAMQNFVICIDLITWWQKLQCSGAMGEEKCCYMYWKLINLPVHQRRQSMWSQRLVSGVRAGRQTCLVWRAPQAWTGAVPIGCGNCALAASVDTNLQQRPLTYLPAVIACVYANGERLSCNCRQRHHYIVQHHLLKIKFFNLCWNAKKWYNTCTSYLIT